MKQIQESKLPSTLDPHFREGMLSTFDFRLPTLFITLAAK